MQEKIDRSVLLTEISKQLRGLVSGPEAESFVLPGNTVDESMLVGSPDSFLVLASVLVEIVAHAEALTRERALDIDDDVIGDVPVVWSDRVKGAFSEHSPIWIVCAYLAQDDKLARSVAKAVSDGMG